MTEKARLSRNRMKLSECDPAFARKAAAILRDVEGKGERPRIQHGWRSTVEQARLERAGRSKTLFGFHNITRHGRPCSFAIDVVDDNNPEGATDTQFYRWLRSAAEAHGLAVPLEWDRYHVQPAKFTSARQVQSLIDAGEEVTL